MTTNILAAPPSPTPYPTSGNAVPKKWECETTVTTSQNVTTGVTSGTEYDRCAVTEWQTTREQTVIVTMSPAASSTAYTGGYNSGSHYGSWSSDFPTFLGKAVFTLAFCMFVAIFFVTMAKRAMKA